MSNLLEKASIITTPTAYSSGFIHSVKPEENLGSNIVINGDFSNGSTSWIIEAAWTISDGVANGNGASGTSQELVQGGNITNGKSYFLTYEVKNYVSGSVKTRGPNTSYKSGNGIYTFPYVANGPLTFVGASFYGSITNISLKEVIGADFTFTRNSPATRVNSQGLVESVQILGSNVVTNGDFSQIGSELITNGDFATNTDWTLVGSATISNGRGNLVSVSDKIYQEPTLSQGKIYKITFDVVNYTTGNLRVFLGSTGDAFLEVSSNGSYIAYLKSIGGIDKVQFRSSGGVFVGAITNVSVVEIIDWTAGDGWSFGGNKASCDGTQTSATNLIQTISTNIQNQLVKISFTLDISAGTLSGSLFNSGGTEFDALTTSGNYSVEATSGDINPNIVFQGDANFVGSISNVVIKSVTNDTDLPRINYENGSGSWLLEASSSNLITYSEDFSQWIFNNNPTVSSAIFVSPSGENNASLIDLSADTDARVALNFGNNSTEYTFSIYLKKHQSDSDGTFPLAYYNGSDYIKTYVNLTDVWKRFNITFTNPSGGAIGYGLSRKGTTSDETLTRCYAWGGQIEEKAFATSYIPTSGSPQTRAADLATDAGNSDLISSTEGVLYAEIAALANDNTKKAISINNGGLTDYLFFRYSSNNQFQILFRSGGNNIVNQFVGLANNLDFNKIAFSYKLNEFKTFVNGVQIGSTVTSGIVFNQTINSLDFDEFNGTNNFQGKVKCVAVFKEASTDAELICLTTI